MTPEEFETWQDEYPDWISQETRVLAACIKDISHYIDYDIGLPMKGERNGDAMWYVLTDDEGLLIILCTPHAIFTESNLGEEEASYSILTHPLPYLENLRDMGIRALTKEEYDEFKRGTL